MMRKTGISLLLLLLTASSALAEVVVIVRKEAQTAGKYVRVCDIARVDGPEEQAREVANTVLGPAPTGGESQEITRWDIETRLYEMGVGARVAFAGNDVVRVVGAGGALRQPAGMAEPAFRPLVETPAQPAFHPVTRREQRENIAAQPSETRASAGASMNAPGNAYEKSAGNPVAGFDDESKTRVARAIGDYFGDQYRAGNAKRADIEVSASVAGATGGVSAFAYELRVESAEGKIPGRAKVTLAVRDEAGGAERRVTVAADTEVHGLALVAVRNIARGETIRSGDVKVARVKMEWGQNYLPPRTKVVAGREAGRALKPGDVILAGDAVAGEAVKRRQLVIVDTVGKGWRLQTKARAHEAGAVGDLITVEDLETKAKYPVRVTGPGTVSVVVDKDKIIYERQ